MKVGFQMLAIARRFRPAAQRRRIPYGNRNAVSAARGRRIPMGQPQRGCVHCAFDVRRTAAEAATPLGLPRRHALSQIAADGNPGLWDATALRLPKIIGAVALSQGRRSRQPWAAGRNRVAVAERRTRTIHAEPNLIYIRVVKGEGSRRSQLSDCSATRPWWDCLMPQARASEGQNLKTKPTW